MNTEQKKETVEPKEADLPITISPTQSLQMIRNPMLMPGALMKRLVYQAQQFYGSGLLPESIKSPQAALVIMMKGIELGFSPMEAFAHIHVIKGKPSISAEGMKNLVYHNCPTARIEIIESTDETCTIEGEKPNHKPFRFTFTLDDAKKADLIGKLGDMYRKYPKAMLFSRACSALCRAYFSEFLCGVSYTPEELDVPVSEDGAPINVTPEKQPVHVAPVQKRPTSKPPIEAEISPPREEAPEPEPDSFDAYEPSPIVSAIEHSSNVTEMAEHRDMRVPSQVEQPPMPDEIPGDLAITENMDAEPASDFTPTDRLATEEEQRVMWSSLKRVYGDDAKIAKQAIIGLTEGKTASKEWTLSDYTKVMAFVNGEMAVKNSEAQRRAK